MVLKLHSVPRKRLVSDETEEANQAHEEDLETEEANPVHEEDNLVYEEATEVVPSSGVGEGSSSDVGEGSSSDVGPPSSGAAPEEGDRGPIDWSVLKTFKDHIAYLIWHGEEKAAIVKAMSLLEGALFGQEDKDLNVVCF
ncbi:hypothetical protein LguiB_012689 [Lonicera macranthoides]